MFCSQAFTPHSAASLPLSQTYIIASPHAQKMWITTSQENLIKLDMAKFTYNWKSVHCYPPEGQASWCSSFSKLVAISMEGDKNNGVPQMYVVETSTTGQKWQQKIPTLQSKTIIKKTKTACTPAETNRFFMILVPCWMASPEIIYLETQVQDWDRARGRYLLDFSNFS